MTGTIVALYGPPASGKDTITSELSKVDQQFRLFQRIKAGSGRQDGYRMVSPAQLDDLHNAGDIIWENTRYNARYAIDRSGLESATKSSVPVVHVGQPQAIAAMKDALTAQRVIVVELYYDRREAVERIAGRGDEDLEARLAAWDETPRLLTAHLRIDTSQVPPQLAAIQIVEALTQISHG
ncbi:kinase [Pseudonocardia sp. N23]|uniref:kinase n=1 Tax=Pseudonocardia sp. N23 TaxID=1987376 RepID=UPI001C0EB393|nr:kinase [Pseudonocardia sp. N23]